MDLVDFQISKEMCLSIYVGTCLCSLVIMRPIANEAESVKSHFNNFYQTLTATAPEVQKGINKGPIVSSNLGGKYLIF